jgi:23S rRNA (adenine2503-C2)-methyltransferase
MEKEALASLSLSELQTAIGNIGEPDFRYQQVAKWLYQKRVAGFDAMKNIPKTCRGKLAQKYALQKLTIEKKLVSQQKDAVKFAFSSNGDIFESVLLYDKKRRTACISSQLGCGLGCTFCETGKMGFVRNLTLHELTGQLIAVNDYLASTGDKLLTNIVFMGMGEALSNFINFKNAAEIITSEFGLGLAQKRITVSTAGIVPSIRKLRESALNVGLAVSLNTFSNELRNTIMPVNKTYPIESVVSAAEEYARSRGEPVTFEYVVVHGENDTAQAVSALVRLLGRVPCKINLIAVNPCTSAPSPDTPSESDLCAFADALFSRGLTVTKRKSRGMDIFGACGQLAGSVGHTKPEKEQTIAAN